MHQTIPEKVKIISLNEAQLNEENLSFYAYIYKAETREGKDPTSSPHLCKRN